MDDLVRGMITAYAPDAWTFWKKFEIFEEVIADQDVATWTDNRRIWMLGCIKADIASFVERAER